MPGEKVSMASDDASLYSEGLHRLISRHECEYMSELVETFQAFSLHAGIE